MISERILRTTFVLLLVLASLSVSLATQAQSIPGGASHSSVAPSSGDVTLRGNTHPLALPKYDRGAAPDNLPLERIVLILKRDPDRQAALDRFVLSQQDRTSPNYHKWLTPAEFGARFGSTDAQVQAVTAWLAGKGFQVNRVSAGRNLIEFSGTSGQVREAFQTQIHQYSVKGQQRWANDRDPRIPAAIAPLVGGILSLNNFSRLGTNNKVYNFTKSPNSSRLFPEVTLANGGCTTAGPCYGVGPADFATIYDVTTLTNAFPAIDGTGQSIAIASDTNLHLSDTQNFRQLFNLPANAPQVILNGPDPGVLPSSEREANLDVQWTGAVAKNAQIQLVVTQTTTASEGASLSAAYIVDNNLAPILTINFGDCEPAMGAGGALFYSVVWEQAAAEGITVVVAAGDSGGAGCDSHLTEIAANQGLAVNGVASTPFNVAVGGTDFDQVGNWSQFWNDANDPNTLGSAKTYIPETTWNDTCAENGLHGCDSPNQSGSDLIAGGGGLSIFNPQPVWQQNTGANQNGFRALPDLSLFAGDGNTGSFYLLCQGDANSNGDPSCNLNTPYLNIQGVGGTSASAAAFAGVMALVNQFNGGRQGNANLVLYTLAGITADKVFHDVTKGTTSVACVGDSPSCSNQTNSGFGILADSNGANPLWSAAPGYDYTTGLGSVDVNNLVTKWTDANLAPTTTALLNFTPTTLAHGQSASFTINVTSQAGTPSGDVALLVNPSGTYLEADGFTLSNGTISTSTNKLPGGTYSVKAHYAGDTAFAPSDSAPISVTVSSEPSQTVVSLEDFTFGPSPVCLPTQSQDVYGANYYLRVDINTTGTACSSAGNATIPTGTVTVTDNGNPLAPGTFTLNGRGYLEISSKFFSVGFHNVIATYSGDTSYNASASTSFVFEVVAAPVPVTLAASSTSVATGSNVTLTATIRGSQLGVNPTGTITFFGNGAPLGSSNVVASTDASNNFVGIATFTFQANQATTVFAQYNGDANYAVSTSASINILVGTPTFSLSASPASLSVTAGQNVMGTITVIPKFGFTGTVSLACTASTLPLAAACSFSPASVTIAADGKPVSSTITVTTGGPTVILSKLNPAGKMLQLFSAGGLLAFGSLFFLGRGRRRSRALFACLVSFGLVLLVAGCANVVKPGHSSSSSLTLGTSSVKVAEGADVTLKAFVNADHTVGGTVDFFDSGNKIASGVPVTVGRAFFDTTTLALGSHAITATYSGDSNTKPATQNNPLFQVVTGSITVQVTGTSGATTQTLPISLTLN